MSLTSFLTLHDVKLRFLNDFPKPSFSSKGVIKAPNLSKNPARIGTAFDYLMRFYLERLNPICITQDWVAMNSLRIVESTKMFATARSIIIDAVQAKRAYLQDGIITDDLLRSVVLLAQLDVIYRAGILDSDFGTVTNDDLLDLRNLASLIDPSLFKAERTCVLNPTFGAGSELVGGADADFLLDETLVEIKTTKNLDFSREYWNQLVGYYILWKISGKLGEAKDARISRLGIYFSRYGLFHTVSTTSIDSNPGLNNFLRWFENRATQVFSQ